MQTKHIFRNADNGKVIALQPNKNYEIVATVIRTFRIGNILRDEIVEFTHHVRLPT